MSEVITKVGEKEVQISNFETYVAHKGTRAKAILEAARFSLEELREAVKETRERLDLLETQYVEAKARLTEEKVQAKTRLDTAKNVLGIVGE
jgi:phage shock protein A